MNLTVKYERNRFQEEVISYNADAAIVCEIQDSYSNIMLIFTLDLNGSSNTFTNMTLVKWNSATKRLWDTFKINRVVAIPNSKFLLASIDNYGAIFYHTGINDIIFTINVTEFDSPKYISQLRDQYG